MGLCKCLYRLVRNFLVVFFVIVFLPGLPPKTDFKFEAYTIAKPANLSGALEVNNLLDNGERLFEGQLHGPEALLKRGDDIYASVHGGEVIKINGDHITHVAKFGKPCEGIVQESICGRPLGLAFDTIGNNLIVADAYYGIWSVDLATGKKTQLISPTEELDGKIRRPAKLFNSVAVSKSGDIYWTDSSSDFPIEDGVFVLFANPSGRLFKYDRKTKKNEALIDEVLFANGVALSPNEDFIVVTELASRLLRYYLKGPKAGTWDVFIDRLPGTTDNLTPDADGLWAPLVISIDDEHPALWQSASNTPLIRKFLARVLALIELPFKLIEQVYPNPFTAKVVHTVGHFESLGEAIMPNRQTILRIDWQGKIVGSLHGFDRSVHAVAHVLEDGDYLYLGSFSNRYLGRVKLPQSYKSAKTTQAPPATQKETVKPVATPKPTVTTTTPKPTTTKAPTTTTSKPATAAPTTTTAKPTTKAAPKTTTTPTPTTKAAPKTTTTPTPTTKAAPKTTTAAPKTTKAAPKTTASPKAAEKPKEPAPIHENIREDTKPPAPEKIKVIKRGGEGGEL